MCPLGALGPHVVCAHNVFTMCPLGIWVLVPSVCDSHWGVEAFTLTTTQSSNLSHDKWLANLFSSGLPSPELPINFPLAIRRVLMSPFLTSSSSMLELSGWSIDLGQASLELMFLSSLCWVHRL